MRDKITLACTECKQRNYNTTKSRAMNAGRAEQVKYCKFCNKRTKHRETR